MYGRVIGSRRYCDMIVRGSEGISSAILAMSMEVSAIDFIPASKTLVPSRGTWYRRCIVSTVMYVAMRVGCVGPLGAK